MTMGKRQLVLAALVVALGAAVYLNCVFSGNGAQKLPATQAVASGTDRQFGQTLLVNASAASSNKKAVSTSGKASAAKTAVSGTDDYFSQARLSRQKAQDTAKEDITKLLEDTKANTAVKKDAVTKAAVITQNLLREADIETLVKAKGYQDCIATLNNDQCNVIVKTKTPKQSDAIVIQDIVAGQTGLSFDKIKIIERT